LQHVEGLKGKEIMKQQLRLIMTIALFLGIFAASLGSMPPAIAATTAELWAVDYRWGAPQPGYDWAQWPTFEGWMNVLVENRGDGDAFNVTATVTAWPPNNTISDAFVTVGDIPVGGSAWSVDTFSAQVDTAALTDPNEALFWRIEYDDATGVHHVIENVPGVRLADTMPSMQAGPDQTVYEGVALDSDIATFTDPRPSDLHTAAIVWGDGSPVDYGVVSESEGSGTVSGSHLYHQGGTYTVKVTVCDDDATCDDDTFTVTVVAVSEADIKPGGYPNSINLSSRGVVPVAILTTDDFDATTVDPVTVKFADALPLRWAWEDVDYDGDLDLVFHFKTQELNLDEYSTEATLSGQTFGGMPFEGTDTVNTVP
jgi:hypothetical protein